MAKEKAVDPMKVVYERAHRMAKVYSNDPYWLMMSCAAHSIECGSTTQDVIDGMEKQYACWGPSTSNSKTLGVMIEKLKECEVVSPKEE